MTDKLCHKRIDSTMHMLQKHNLGGNKGSKKFCVASKIVLPGFVCIFKCTKNFFLQFKIINVDEISFSSFVLNYQQF